MKKHNKLAKKISLAERMSMFILEQKLVGDRNYREDNVLFISDVRDEMGGNFEWVYNALDKNKWNVDIFLKDKQLHEETISDAKEIARKLRTAKYIFLEDVYNYLQFYTPIKGQEIIQLWHAAGAYKKFGFSRKNEQIKISPGHRKYTKAIVSAESIKACYAEAYDISEEKIIATGVPRTDIFFDNQWKEEKRQMFHEKHPETRDKKIILFAPTYRGTKVPMAYYDMSKVPIREMQEKFGEEYVFVTKLHPAAYNNMVLQGQKLGDGSNFWIDISDIRDINDVLPVADILITDYSSVIFDWLLLDKPIIYYVYDKQDYQGDRGLYYSFDEYVYGEVATNGSELVKAIETADMSEEKRESFREKFMSACDGKSTERVINLLGR